MGEGCAAAVIISSPYSWQRLVSRKVIGLPHAEASHSGIDDQVLGREECVDLSQQGTVASRCDGERKVAGPICLLARSRARDL